MSTLRTIANPFPQVYQECVLKLLRNFKNRIFHLTDLTMKSTEARPVISAISSTSTTILRVENKLRFPFQVCGLLVSTSFLLFENSVNKSLSYFLSLASLECRVHIEY